MAHALNSIPSLMPLPNDRDAAHPAKADRAIVPTPKLGQELACASTHLHRDRVSPNIVWPEYKRPYFVSDSQQLVDFPTVDIYHHL
jgi:hypothetical protein